MMYYIDQQIKLANKFDLELNKIFLQISKKKNRISSREKLIINYFEKLISIKNRYSKNYINNNSLSKISFVTKIVLLFNSILSFIYLFKYLIHFFIKEKTIFKKTDIIYLQKKSSRTSIEKTYSELVRLAKINKININIVSLEFKNFYKNNKNTLNSISNFKVKLFNAYKHILISIFKDFQIISLINPSLKDLKIFIENLFISKIITEIETKVFLGSLFDKPIYTLIYMNKDPKKYLCSFSDGYTFYPMPRPNYNFCDIFYATCKSELNEFNNLGGYINKTELVGSVRLFKNNYIDIDDILLKKINTYKKTILISSTQGFENNVNKNKNSLFSKGLIEKLNLFYDEIYNNANDNKNYLYLIKEKKGELDLLDTKKFSKLNYLENIHIIRCKHPAESNQNRFIDLLKYSNLVISLALNSTTIFEALNINKPVLIYKYVKFITPWDDFQNFTYIDGELNKKINFIFDSDPIVVDNLIKKLKISYNIHNNACENIILNLKNNLIK